MSPASSQRKQIVLEPILNPSERARLLLGDFEPVADGWSVRLDLSPVAQALRQPLRTLHLENVLIRDPEGLEGPSDAVDGAGDPERVHLEPVEWGSLLAPGAEADLGRALMVAITAFPFGSGRLSSGPQGVPGAVISMAGKLMDDPSLREVLGDPPRMERVLEGAVSVLDGRPGQGIRDVSVWGRSCNPVNVRLALPALVAAAVYAGVPVSLPAVERILGPGGEGTGGTGFWPLPAAVRILAAEDGGAEDGAFRSLLRHEMDLPGFDQALDAVIRGGLSERDVLDLCDFKGPLLVKLPDLAARLPDMGAAWWRGESDVCPGRSRMFALASSVLKGSIPDWPSRNALPLWRSLGAVRAAFTASGDDARLLRAAAFVSDSVMCRKALCRGLDLADLVGALGRRLAILPSEKGGMVYGPYEAETQVAIRLQSLYGGAGGPSAVWGAAADVADRIRSLMGLEDLPAEKAEWEDLPAEKGEWRMLSIWAEDLLNWKYDRPQRFSGWGDLSGAQLISRQGMRWMAEGAPGLDEETKVDMLREVGSWMGSGTLTQDGAYAISELPYWVGSMVPFDEAGRACAGLIRSLPAEKASLAVGSPAGEMQFGVHPYPDVPPCPELRQALRELPFRLAPREAQMRRSSGNRPGGRLHGR